jgi:hypothetical protein
MSARAPEGLKRLKDSDWEVLLERIKIKKCTPILGTGTRFDAQTTRSKIAQEWAKQYDFPLPQGSDNLARVARFVSIKFDGPFTKGKLVDRLQTIPKPDFDDPKDGYNILAKLPLPIYITTNYDDFMVQALSKANKDVKREMCRWNQKSSSSIFADGFTPTVASPVVYHFHGWTDDVDSLVLTEDDYFEFLISVSRDKDLIPPRIEQAMTGSSLLLLGYRLDDWDFRVMFHLLATYLERSTSRTHVAVQIAPLKDEEPEELRRKAQDYLNLYFEKYKKLDIRIYWGSCQDFLEELNTRWAKSAQ